jgi:3-hydroxyisobutyrate dehydrogenase-like beta-hydroxyacid dehydrogenase
MFKIGICGIGKMGSEITKRLIEYNQTVSIWNRTKEKLEKLKKNRSNSYRRNKRIICSSQSLHYPKST